MRWQLHSYFYSTYLAIIWLTDTILVRFVFISIADDVEMIIE